MWHGVMPPAVPAFGYHCGETFVQHYMDGCEGQYWAEIKDSVPVACGDPPLRQRHFVQQEPTMQFHEDGLLQTQHQEPRKWEEDQFRQQQAQLKKEQAASMKQREVLEQKEQELQIEAERLKQEWKLVKKAKDELLQFEKKTMQQLNRERLEMRQREVLLQERAQEQETHFANVRRGMKEKEADFKCRLARVTERELEVTFREVTLEGKVEPKPTATASTSVGSQQSSKKELWRLGKGEAMFRFGCTCRWSPNRRCQLRLHSSAVCFVLQERPQVWMLGRCKVGRGRLCISVFVPSKMQATQESGLASEMACV